MMNYWHIFVTGHVQGVGYRRFAQKKAQELGLKGWVRNLPDQRVEIKVAGEVRVLEYFHTELKRGPHYAEVTDVSLSEIAAETFEPFRILPDGER